MKMPHKTHALQQSALFSHLAEEALAHIAQKVKIRQYFPAETIVWQNTPSDSLFIIVSGIVAVKKVRPNGTENVLAYLLPGNNFGEVGLLENQPRSATIVALSDVEVLVLKREDFLDILHAYPAIAIELARMLGRYLTRANQRLGRHNKNLKVILLLDLFEAAGSTTFGVCMAKVMAARTKQPTVYTEYPSPQKLMLDLRVSSRQAVFKHSSGFDIALSHHNSKGPGIAQNALLFDRLLDDYQNVIVTLNELPRSNWQQDESLHMLFDNVSQVLFYLPSELPQAKLNEVQQFMRSVVPADQTNFFSMGSMFNGGNGHSPEFDFVLPTLDNFPQFQFDKHHDFMVPEPMEQAIDVLIDRLDRNNQLSLFIPTTVDTNQTADTAPYVQQTMQFLAERFGGATSATADGIWNSEEAGLVGEKVHIVNTFTSQTDLQLHLEDVIKYVKKLKSDLRQEAMAMKVNNKLTLI